VVDNRYLRGPLDLPALRAAFADVAGRHDALRMVFDSIAPDARVRVLERIEPPVEELDLSGLDEAARQTVIEELSYRENRRCFDLGSGPLWHAWVVRLDATTHLLNLCLLHVIADGWAPKVFLTDLLQAYGGRTGAAPPP